jgi:hypothetical protein
MKRALQYIIFSVLAWAAPMFDAELMAQERCATVEYNRSLHPDPELHKIEFERWLGEKLLRRASRQSRQQAQPYQIPVVVHIVHNGESIGTGVNISEAQILSQIRVLNVDFRRENADAANTPAEFLPVAGSLDVEFVLAKQDPEGLPTNGIVRVNGGKNSWTANDNYELKEKSYWPAEQYMNIWVCNLTGHIGYAQFPESDLAGMENSSTNRLTDGIVIWHKAFGSVDDGAFNLDPTFNKGRTATHETGHWLALNHIWGADNNCNDTDYVSDTPNQKGQTSGCPAHPKTDGCSDMVMFQNFLDYTDDECMNLFTKGQVARMITVLENSPRRNSLLTSPGLQAPNPLANDLGIRSIISPDAAVCSNLITPIIELRNYGSNTVTSARIRFVLDGAIVETRDFSLSLNYLESAQIAFSALTIPSGAHNVAFRIVLTNGGTDSGDYNNEYAATVIVPSFGDVPFAENFNVQPPGWVTYNPDGQITWQIATAPNEMATNRALKLNFFEYEDKLGEVDIFYSPVLDLSSAPAAALAFDVSHARYLSSNDRLQVIALVNCAHYTEGAVVYDKAGDSLKTAPATTSLFTPANESQWRKERVDLSAFIGEAKIQFAFVGINDWGNNLYLDNIALFTEATTDVALVRMVSPSVVTCEEQATPRILVQNTGSVLLTSFAVEYTLNGAPAETFVHDGLNLSFGAEQEIALPELTLGSETNSLEVTLKDPNGSLDFNPQNNSKTFTIVVNKNRDRIPIRENFDDDFTPPWAVINPTGGRSWETIATNFGQSLYFNAFDNELIGDEAWLVSPVLDFSRANQAGLLFDMSHAVRGMARESLTILASTDCGVTFNQVSFNLPETKTANENWIPADENDWARNISVNLNSVAKEENVRIAFVVRNQNGNNLYLDNIDFYTTANPDPIDIAELFSVYGYDLTDPGLTDLKITFNLPERENVRYSVITATGQLETDGILTDVLNQTYPVNLPERLQPGVYFVRVQIGEKYYTRRVLVF